MKFKVSTIASDIVIEQDDDGNHKDFSSVADYIIERNKNYNIGTIKIKTGDNSVTIPDGKNMIISGASFETLLGSDDIYEAPKPNAILTTSNYLEGYKVLVTIEIITAECVFGMNIFRDLFAGLRDVVGGRSNATQKVLRDSRKTCLNELRKEADSIGANAVIGVDLDYNEFSGGGKSMLMLVASGTAVKVEKIEDESKPEVEAE